MARHLFGLSPSDFAMQKVGTELQLVPGAAGTVWDSMSGGNQITDLTGLDNSAITVVTADSNAQVGFYGPDGVARLFLDFNFNMRFLMVATDLGDQVNALQDSKVDRSELPYINAKTVYGALGDGTTDDRAAIQAAIDAAAGAGGGTVFLPRGIYRTGDALVLKTGVALVGAGATFWPFRFPVPQCSIKPLSSFAGECVISMLGADITASGSAEGHVRISDLELDGSALPAGSVSGIHAQGEVMDVQLSRIVIKLMTHNGLHTNVGTGTKAPHDWTLDSVVSYHNAGYGYSMSMTDGYFRNCVASSNLLDGWLMGPFGSMSMEGCQALFNTLNGMTIAGGTQVGNLSISSFVTDRNGRDGLHFGPSSGTGSPPVMISGLTLNRDGKNGGSGGGGYAGLSINGCANPVIIEGLAVDTGVDDDGSGSNSPQYGIALSGNAYVSVGSGYVHGDTTGWYDDGTNTIVRRGINIGEATGSKGSPTFVYGNGVTTTNGTLDVPQHAIGQAHPREHGAIAWTYDPALVNNGIGGTAGTLYLAAVYVPRTVTATKLYWGSAAAGVSPVTAESFVSLFNAAGARLANVDVTSRVTSTGAFTETISAALTPGLYWVGILINAATMPQVYKAANTAASLVNFGLTGSPAAMRFATAGTGLTATPSSITPGSNVAAQQAYWAALG